MKKRKPLTDENGEVRELMQGDYHDAKPFSMLSAYLQLKLTSLRGRPKAAIKNENVRAVASTDAPTLLEITEKISNLDYRTND